MSLGLIITPVYNSEKYIGETIESVLNQTYQNWEMLIVDDCSSDNTAEVMKRYSDPGIKYFRLKENSGAVWQKLCFRESRGKVDCFSGC